MPSPNYDAVWRVTVVNNTNQELQFNWWEGDEWQGVMTPNPILNGQSGTMVAYHQNSDPTGHSEFWDNMRMEMPGYAHQSYWIIWVSGKCTPWQSVQDVAKYKVGWSGTNEGNMNPSYDSGGPDNVQPFNSNVSVSTAFDGNRTMTLTVTFNGDGDFGQWNG